jgi:hypothetical protein
MMTIIFRLIRRFTNRTVEIEIKIFLFFFCKILFYIFVLKIVEIYVYKIIEIICGQVDRIFRFRRVEIEIIYILYVELAVCRFYQIFCFDSVFCAE